MIESNFDSFLLPKNIKKGLGDLGYKIPTKVQYTVFNHILKGENLIVKSHTGSGKTAAFCLPILIRITKKNKNPLAIVLVPTRELAKQVGIECQRLGAYKNINIVCIYGGISFEKQIQCLKNNCEIVIGTPGRIKDLIKQKILKLSEIKFAVLDEADEMLSMGFWDDVMEILQQTSKKRQTLLFSATMPKLIKDSCNFMCKEPVVIDLNINNTPIQSIKQILHREDESLPKARNLLYALEYNKPKSSIIFCNTREETDIVYRYLKRFGFNLAMLSGELPQKKREEVIEKIKNGNCVLLIATDIAARGIDIENISHIFHFSLPENEEIFIHRSGRTGRIGKKGVVVSLIRNSDYKKIENLKKHYNLKFEEIKLPQEKTLFKLQGDRIINLLKKKSVHVEVGQFKPIADHILKNEDSVHIAAFLLKEYLGEKKPIIFSLKNTNLIKKTDRKLDLKSKENKKQIIEVESKLIRNKQVKSKKICDSKKNDTSFNKLKSSNYTNIYISIGKIDKFFDIIVLANYIAKLSGVDLGSFTGNGTIGNRSSNIEVDNNVALRIVSKINENGLKKNIQCKINNKTKRIRHCYRTKS